MDLKTVKSLIDASACRTDADLKIKNVKIVDVYNKELFPSDVYVKDGYIIGFGGDRKAREEFDGKGRFLIPSLIDSHCHIESSHLSPAEFSDAVVPCGTGTVIADPHEICNVTGLDGMQYMLDASKDIPLSVFLMFPSCVPATPFEHSGAVLNADDVRAFIGNPRVLGLGEMMNYPGVNGADEGVIAKLGEAYRLDKIIDGHAPSIAGDALDSYVSAGIETDHECETPKEAYDKIRKGMYVMLRQGTACQNVLQILPAVNERNFSRFLFCTDDRQPQSITREGHVSHAVNLAIRGGLDPFIAISMATLNAATCYRLRDRGAIAPGKRADFFLSSSLEEGIVPEEVFLKGKLVAKKGKIIAKARHIEPVDVSGKMDVKNFSIDSFSLKLKSNHARVIDIIPGGVVTGAGEAYVKTDDDGNWIHDPEKDILKIAVIERHHGTGLHATALIRGYGLKHGAVATSIAHDSHNIIVVGDNDEDMLHSVEKLIETGGGITMFKDGRELGTHRLEIAGLMTDDSLENVTECLDKMHEICEKELCVNKDIDPFMTLCFMALPVIPSYKLTDSGLFDVVSFSFVDNCL